ncbi:MAG TPA: CAP domain-containing protein [Dehalococcoidia bacterium]
MPKIRTLPRVLLSAFAVSLALMGAAVLQGGGTAEALTNCSVSDSYDSQEQAFLQLINQYRSQNGRPSLTASTNLNRAAAWMAQDLTKGYFSHTDSSGRTFDKRIADCGGLKYNGENIAAGTYRDTAQEAFDAWKASSGHNANMLNSSYRQIGIARYYSASSPYKWYWVTDFSTSNDGTNAGGSSGGGGSTATATATATATKTPAPTATPTSTKAVMTSPANGSTLPPSSVVFRWTAVSGASQYYMYIGTSPGSNNLASASLGTATSVTVSGYASNGSTIYVRLWTLYGGAWQYNDYSYRLPN